MGDHPLIERDAPNSLQYATPVQPARRIRPGLALIGGMFLVLTGALTLIGGFAMIRGLSLARELETACAFAVAFSAPSACSPACPSSIAGAAAKTRRRRCIMARTCAKCSQRIPRSSWIDGRKRELQRRKYCLTCSPFGSHNTRIAGEVRRAQTTGILCAHCSKPLTAKQAKGRVCWNCRYKERSVRRLLQAYEIVGYACWRCGYGKGAAGMRLLDFHHVERGSKCFGLDCRNIVNLAYSRVISEMKKCVLLCANCHRECETGLVSPDDIAELHRRRWKSISQPASCRPSSDPGI